MITFEDSYNLFVQEYVNAYDTPHKIAAIYKLVSRYPLYTVRGKYVNWKKYQMKKQISDDDIELRSYIKKGIDTSSLKGKIQVELACIAEACILRKVDVENFEEHLTIACWKILADNTDNRTDIISIEDMEDIISEATHTTTKPNPYYKNRSMKIDSEIIDKTKVTVKEGDKDKIKYEVKLNYNVKNGKVLRKPRTTYKKFTSREEFISLLDMTKSYTDNIKQGKLKYGVSRKYLDRYIKKFDIQFEVSGNKKPKKSIEQIEDKWKLSERDWKLPLDKLFNLVSETINTANEANKKKDDNVE